MTDDRKLTPERLASVAERAREEMRHWEPRHLVYEATTPRLAPDRIAAYRRHVEDALTHSARAEEDTLHETGLALVDAWEAFANRPQDLFPAHAKAMEEKHGPCVDPSPHAEQGSCCPEHGPDVSVDEDGCCVSCGMDAMWFTPNERVIREQAHEYIAEITRIGNTTEVPRGNDNS